MIVLIVLLVLLLFGGLPVYPYSRNWGYGPSGLLTVILVIVLLWFLLGGRGVPIR